jgi:hypothetical protein
VKDQHAADAERPVAPACAEQELFDIGKGKIFCSRAGVDNLMHVRLIDGTEA